MKRRYFGTDGFRGRAGDFPLDTSTVFALGRAAGVVLGAAGASAVVGMDPRESSGWISEALMQGLEEEGVAVSFAGVLPTSGVAWLCAKEDYTFGAMVSASHNPYRDNGIKFFSGEGFKLPDETEVEIETILESFSGAFGKECRPREREAGLHRQERYLEGLLSLWRGKELDGVRLVLDCANGAAYRIAPALFRKLGADVEAVFCSPDGRNINHQCGSQAPERLAAAVTGSGADMGFAFDGDADRCIAITPSGKRLDGDYLLYWKACQMAAQGELHGGCVVGTVMSNLWLEKALAEKGIGFHRAPVGDRYVLQRMREVGGVLGGEPSGHVLFLNEATTGDGLLSAMAYAALARGNGGMEVLADGIEPYPQVLLNIPVREKILIEERPAIRDAVSHEEECLGKEGRIVLRYSGTEPLIRLMVEADSEERVAGVIERLRPVLEGELGPE